MPKVLSRKFGAIDYAAGEQFVFPNGLPGFPLETAFLPIEVPEQLPLLYLQSLRTPDLCFVGVPVNCIVADYELSLNADDLACIGLSPDAQPGSEMLCLALVCFKEDGTGAANLRAPIIINVNNRIAVQMIQIEDRYPFRFPLNPEKEVTMCS
jgi:flagellar assembly factor FliW